MTDWLHDLSDWVVGFADSDWAIVVLGISSFAESIFFPVPPDPLLVGVAIIQPHLAIWLGVLVTLTSVAGAVVGHWIGRRFGRPILDKLFRQDKKVALAERMIKKYGAWATLIAAFTPIPYKVFAISAGALDLDRRTFILASLVGRGARFISIGVLVYVYGEQIEDFIGDHFGVLTLAVMAALLAAVGTWALVHRRRARRALR